MKKLFVLIGLMVMMVVVSGCGTIVHGVHQDVEIKTTPAGATARIGDQTCITPCNLNVWRKSEEIILTYDGAAKKYEVKTSLNNRTNGWSYYLGNITLFGWFPGMIVDNIAGGKWSIDNFYYDFKAEEAKKDGQTNRGANSAM